jgi:nucleoid-associated protein YgaU
MTLQTSVLYQGPGGSSAYDAMGNIVFYQYRVNSQRLDQYTVTYLKKEGYLESATSGINVSNLPDVRPATDESYYNVRGERIAIAQHTEYANGTVADTVRAFAYDGNGQIISRRDGTANGSTIDQGSTPALKNQHYVYVNGQQVAHYDESTTVDVLSQVTAFSNSNGTGDYVVQQGDTLKSIAQAVYGNASLWYVVAQANALNGDADLAVGLSLSIPAVTTSKNDSTTFKPYNPSEIQGSTTPDLPVIAPPPPPPKQHCNAIAAIVVIAVVVVASILTAGAALAAAGATLGETFAVGATALAGGAGFTAATVGAAALGGFVGNVAGQVAGDALGVHQGFSFGEALTGGLTAGATAGLGGYLQGTATFGEVAANGLPALNTAGKVALAAGSYAAQNASAEIAGQDHHFSWAGVVASAASAFVPSELQLPSEQDALSAIGSGAGTSFLGTLANGVVEGGVQREVSRALGDDHTSSWKSIGENALGTALAQAGVSAVEEQNNPSATGHSGYSFDFTKGGQGVVSGDALDGYQSSDYPSLASSDMYSTYAGAYGTGSASQPTVSTSYGKDNEPGEAWGGPGYSVDAQYPSGAPLYDLGVGEIPVQAPYLAPSLTNEPEITSSADVQPTALEASQGLARFSAWADREGAISTLPVRADLAPKVASLPDVEALYDIQPGWFAQSHAIAEAEKNNPNNSAVQQGVYTVLDGLAMPLFLAEEAVRATGNAPAQAGVSAQWAARASLENNTDDSLTDISNSLYTGGNSLLGLAGGAGVVESATADTVFGSKFVGFSGEGAQLSGATGNYTLRSPFYLDATPG